MLATVANRGEGRVCHVRLKGVEADWLRAIGIFEGQQIQVLRRAVFGGPLHVRTGSGGEFVIDRALAGSIEVNLGAVGRAGER